MRYFTITYYRKSNGRLDESVMVRSSLRTKDYSERSVIVDFQTRRVLKAAVEGRAAPLDFENIVSYYAQFYRPIIQQLAQHHGYELQFSTDES